VPPPPRALAHASRRHRAAGRTVAGVIVASVSRALEVHAEVGAEVGAGGETAEVEEVGEAVEEAGCSCGA